MAFRPLNSKCGLSCIRRRTEPRLGLLRGQARGLPFSLARLLEAEAAVFDSHKRKVDSCAEGQRREIESAELRTNF